MEKYRIVHTEFWKNPVVMDKPGEYISLPLSAYEPTYKDNLGKGGKPIMDYIESKYNKKFVRKKSATFFVINQGRKY
jgi:hypothetical protein